MRALIVRLLLGIEFLNVALHNDPQLGLRDLTYLLVRLQIVSIHEKLPWFKRSAKEDDPGNNPAPILEYPRLAVEV